MAVCVAPTRPLHAELGLRWLPDAVRLHPSRIGHRYILLPELPVILMIGGRKSPIALPIQPAPEVEPIFALTSAEIHSGTVPYTPYPYILYTATSTNATIPMLAVDPPLLYAAHRLPARPKATAPRNSASVTVLCVHACLREYLIAATNPSPTFTAAPLKWTPEAARTLSLLPNRPRLASQWSAMIAIPWFNRVIVFGGLTQSGAAHGSLTVVQPATQRWQWVQPGMCMGDDT